MTVRSAYKSLADAYNAGFDAFCDGEPDNLWSPYANAEEIELWRYGYDAGRQMKKSEEAWAEETERVSAIYRKLFERKD